MLTKGMMSRFLRVLMLAVCALSLSSCAMVGNTLNYLLRLPFQLINTIVP